MDRGSEMQAIVIPGSLEMGSSDQPSPEDVALGEPDHSNSTRTAGDLSSRNGHIF